MYKRNCSCSSNSKGQMPMGMYPQNMQGAQWGSQQPQVAPMATVPTSQFNYGAVPQGPMGMQQPSPQQWGQMPAQPMPYAGGYPTQPMAEDAMPWEEAGMDPVVLGQQQAWPQMMPGGAMPGCGAGPMMAPMTGAMPTGMPMAQPGTMPMGMPGHGMYPYPGSCCR